MKEPNYTWFLSYTASVELEQKCVGYKLSGTMVLTMTRYKAEKLKATLVMQGYIVVLKPIVLDGME